MTRENGEKKTVESESLAIHLAYPPIGVHPSSVHPQAHLVRFWGHVKTEA